MGTQAGDRSGNGNTGTLTNGPTWSNGKHGNALSFNGSTATVNAGNGSSLNLTSQITISAWIKTSGTNDYSGIVQKSSSTLGYQMGFAASNTGRADFFNGVSYISPLNSKMLLIINGIYLRQLTTTPRRVYI